MYGRHFESMYTGSMYGQGFGLFAIWGYVISHERGGIVELNPKLLSNLFGEPIEAVSTLVNKLCSPDDDSRSKEQEGRRLVKIGQFAYQVVNAVEYAKIASEADRRDYLTQKQREHRQRQHLSTPVNKSQPSDSDSDSTTASEEKEVKEKETLTPPKKTRYLEFVLLSEEEYRNLIERLGDNDTRAYIERLNNYIGSKGKKYKSHYHTILNWSQKDHDGEKQSAPQLPPVVRDAEGKTPADRARERIEALRRAADDRQT